MKICIIEQKIKLGISKGCNDYELIDKLLRCSCTYLVATLLHVIMIIRKSLL